MDESREGALIQIVDAASPPEKKSRPKRAVIAVATTLLSGVVLAGFVLMRRSWRAAAQDPLNAARMVRLLHALGRRRP